METINRERMYEFSCPQQRYSILMSIKLFNQLGTNTFITTFEEYNHSKNTHECKFLKIVEYFEYLFLPKKFRKETQ